MTQSVVLNHRWRLILVELLYLNWLQSKSDFGKFDAYGIWRKDRVDIVQYCLWTGVDVLESATNEMTLPRRRQGWRSLILILALFDQTGVMSLLAAPALSQAGSSRTRLGAQQVSTRDMY